MIESALAEAGVKCRVVGGFLAGAIGELPAGMASSPEVWVSAAQLEAARHVLKELQAKQSPFRIPSWTCPRCETEVESELGTCWNCLYSPSSC